MFAGVQRSLHEDLHSVAQSPPRNHVAMSSASSSTSSTAPNNDSTMELARGVFGALAREFGDLSKCPTDTIQVAMVVCGITDPAVVDALKSAIHVVHERESECAKRDEEAIRSKSPRSVERKRAFLERRLRYHILLPAEPLQPSVRSTRSSVREYIRTGTMMKSAERHRNLPQPTAEPSSSKRNGVSPVSARTATPAGLSSRSSSQANAHVSSCPRRPTTANSARPRPLISAAPRRSTSPDQKQIQLELLNLRRMFIELPSKVPPLQKVQQQKAINTSSVDGQVQLFSEIFNLIDTDGLGKIDRNAFIAFGRRISGSESCRVFNAKMFQQLILKSQTNGRANVPQALQPKLSHHGASAKEESHGATSPRSIEEDIASAFISKDTFLSALFPGASSKIQSFRKSQQESVSAAIAAEGHGKRWEDDWSAEDMNLLLVMFRGCDADHDGLISAEDLVRFSSQHAAKEKFTEHEYHSALVMYKAQMSPFDQDGDGMVNLEEFSRMQKPVFDMQNKREEEQQPTFLFSGVKSLW